MAGQDGMEPLERLLNLVGLLLDTEHPLTFEQISDTLDAYRAQNTDTAKRMFERDKDILREYGVPLELRDLDAWGGEQGYLIPKELYYLPEIAFTPEELGSLLVAAQGGGGETPVEQAAQKLLYGADGGALAGLSGGPLAAGSDARGALLLDTARAAQDRRRVRFGYRTSQGKTSEREVDAFAVVFGRGHWYLVGHDRERDDIRAFRLSRFLGDLVDAGEGVGPPASFSAADHVERGPWVPGGEELAAVAFAPHIAWAAANSLRGASTRGPRGDGWVVVEIPMSDEHEMAGWILGFGADAEVLEPEELRANVMARLEAVRG
jgi:proteasome accessory factor B